MPGRTFTFEIHDPVCRKITRPGLTDRVVHTALDSVTREVFEKYYIYDTYACRKGKGTLKCVESYQKHMRSAYGSWADGFYLVSFDFSKYFATISHDVVRELYERLISNEKICHYLNVVLDASYETQSDGDYKGCPIGFLTSQHNGNLVLSIVDHALKDIMGIKHYIRYMDDGRALVHTYEEAMEIVDVVDMIASIILKQKLSLKKTYITKFRGYDNFLGYEVHPHKLLPKASTLKRANRRLTKKLWEFRMGECPSEKLYATAQSHIAYLSHTVQKESPLATYCMNLGLGLIEDTEFPSPPRYSARLSKRKASP